MDELRIHPPPVAAEDLERLLDAARAALKYSDDLDKHAPEGTALGGEGRVHWMLREAVRRCSFEIRDCPECDGGIIPGPTAHPMERPIPECCSSCGGSGRVSVFSYGRPRGRR